MPQMRQGDYHTSGTVMHASKHRGIRHEYLQEYLNEFCYKFNRKYFEDKTFELLVLASVLYRPIFKHRTYKGAVVCE